MVFQYLSSCFHWPDESMPISIFVIVVVHQVDMNMCISRQRLLHCIVWCVTQQLYISFLSVSIFQTFSELYLPFPRPKSPLPATGSKNFVRNTTVQVKQPMAAQWVKNWPMAVALIELIQKTHWTVKQKWIIILFFHIFYPCEEFLNKIM